jgi:hypothetical protein
VSEDSPRPQIRLAAVIDEFGAAASDSPVEHPVLAQKKVINYLVSRLPNLLESFHRFAVANPFSRVLDDLPATCNVFSREHALPLYPRTPHS